MTQVRHIGRVMSIPVTLIIGSKNINIWPRDQCIFKNCKESTLCAGLFYILGFANEIKYSD